MTDPYLRYADADSQCRIGPCCPDVEFVPHSQIKESIAHILKREGLSGGLQRWKAKRSRRNSSSNSNTRGRKGIIAGLAAGEHSRPAGATWEPTEIPRVLGGMGTVIMSTPRGSDDRRRGAQNRTWAGKCSASSGNHWRTLYVKNRKNARCQSPDKVKVAVKGRKVFVEGPKGKARF